MTSTLQQEAARKLRFTAHRTMRVAQTLYENGYITYMRTDSVTLSEIAITAARAQATEMYGVESVPNEPRRYQSKVKNAQEAHEAIRPAGEAFRTPDQVAGELNADELRLYDLVWKRTVASQMADARGQSVQVRLGATAAGGRDTEFAASGRVITFPGFLRAYVEGADDPEAELGDREVVLPPLAEEDALDLVALEPKGHETQPPARFTEASLVRALEEMGVGRPSTYASILDTIQDRGYVWKKGSALVPSFTAFSVVGLLERHFTNLVDYAFTARMEDDLDGIAAGEQEANPWLTRFYFGNGQIGLHVMVTERLGEIDAREVNSIPLGTDPDGAELVVRVGRYGPYVQRGEDRASIPEDLAPDELTVDKALELLNAPSEDRVLGIDPESSLTVVARAGRYGPYVQLGEVNGDSKEKPRTASLFKTMSLDTVTLDDALRLLSLPRVVGTDPADGQDITAQNGRYGPYIKKGSDSRSLESEKHLFTITLDEALAVLAEPKRRGGRNAEPKPPLRELGPDPVSGKPVVVKEGRFGPYVTDGETNASLRKDDEVETIEIARAAELLQDRRDRGPAPKRGARAKKPGAKKPGPKKSATKKGKSA
jgi:DNA topoisomerase-1